MFAAAVAGVTVVCLPQIEAAGRPHSIAFCKCCAASQDQQCATLCSAVSAGGECPVAVQYDAAPSQDANPLNGLSLKELDLGKPTPSQLEDFRRFLERARKRAQSDYRKALRVFGAGDKDQAKLQSARSRYEEALVNYNHGIYAYKVAAGVRQD
jgi:hypothetical protein